MPGSCEYRNSPLPFVKGGEFPDQMSISFSLTQLHDSASYRIVQGQCLINFIR